MTLHTASQGSKATKAAPLPFLYSSLQSHAWVSSYSYSFSDSYLRLLRRLLLVLMRVGPSSITLMVLPNFTTLVPQPYNVGVKRTFG